MLVENNSRQALFTWLVIAFAGLFFIYHLICASGQLIDDAYISFRYAVNLAEGKGLRFNPGGGVPVEGYSNLLWVILLAGAKSLGVPVVWAAKVLGTASAAGIVFIILLWIKKKNAGSNPAVYAPLAVSIVLAHYGIAYWAMAGLETALYALLLLAGTLSALGPDRRMRPTAGVLFALAAICRPEGAFYFVVALAAGIAFSRKFSRKEAAFCLIFAGLFVPVLLFRLIYYGKWFPNTYYAKVGSFSYASFHLGFFYILEFFKENLLTAVAILISLIFFIKQRKRLDPAVGMGLVMIAAQVAYVIRVGGDWMPNSRFLVPVVPFVAIVFAPAAGWLIKAYRKKGKNLWLPAASFALILFAGEYLYRAPVADDLKMHRNFLDGHGGLAEWLVEHSEPGQTIALNDIGLISFRTGLRVIDLAGLADARIASLKRKQDMNAVVSYILGQDPEWIVLASATDPDKYIYWSRTDSMEPLYLDPRFQLNYRYLKSWRYFSAYYFMLFKRSKPESPLVARPGMAPGLYRLYESAKIRDFLPLAGRSLDALAEIHRNYPDFLKFREDFVLTYEKIGTGQVTGRPELAPAHLSKEHIESEILQLTGNSQAAEEKLLAGLAKNPRDAELLIRVGDYYRSRNKSEDARHMYSRALAILGIENEQTPLAIIRRAFLSLQLGMPDSAVAMYERAIKLLPSEPELYKDLGILYRQLGNLDSSIAALEKACSLPGASDIMFFNLGRSYEDAGKIQQAIRAMRRCLELSPELAQAHIALARLFAALPESRDSAAFHLEYVRRTAPHLCSDPSFLRVERTLRQNPAP